MKQGKASSSGPTGQKREPQGTFVNPGAVSYLGNKLGNHADNKDMTLRPTPFSAGRGYKAPGIGMSVHKSGTQGKH